MRTPRGKRFKDLIDSYSRDAGCGSLTEAQRALVRELAMLQCIAEDLQLEYMQTGDMSDETRTQYNRVSNTIRRHLAALGLTPKAPARSSDDNNEGLDPLSYAKRGGTRHKRSKRSE
ncbi:hypothetical protein B2M20_12395 [Nitrobacter vulgaris]|uniref:Terminase n=1 Tax=Nitrobacter vulgaris TaxID=29421 RepID=A0A1V4HXR4_NITVU|nr:hypothetical protein B2M20_12395 [Nitrobacter vulgaris]